MRGSLFPWSLKQGRLRKFLAWNFFQKNLLTRADAIQVTSQQELDQLCALGFKSTTILIPNGISRFDKQDLKFNINRMKNIEPLILMFASRIHPKKGLDLLLKSLRSSHFDFPITLWVAGDFSDAKYESLIMSEVAALNDNIDVTFFGHLGPSELYKMYERAHLFVLQAIRRTSVL